MAIRVYKMNTYNKKLIIYLSFFMASISNYFNIRIKIRIILLGFILTRFRIIQISNHLFININYNLMAPLLFFISFICIFLKKILILNILHLRHLNPFYFTNIFRMLISNDLLILLRINSINC